MSEASIILKPYFFEIKENIFINLNNITLITSDKEKSVIKTITISGVETEWKYENVDDFNRILLDLVGHVKEKTYISKRQAVLREGYKKRAK